MTSEPLPRRHSWLWWASTALWCVGLLLVLVLAGYLRYAGADWDEGQHLHPDERFLTMVALSLEPVDSVAAYFDTEHSSLNPRNRGSRPVYVYGTLPVVVTRLISQRLGRCDYRHLHLVGRRLSASADLLVVLLTGFLGFRLGGRVVALLASAFAACSVLQLQLSHFFVVDTFANLFGTCALCAAVVLATLETPGGRFPTAKASLLGLLFAVSCGVATAIKLNLAPTALLLPGALALVLLKIERRHRRAAVLPALLILIMGAVVALCCFRVCQPYAFSGPGFWNMAPSSDWVDSLKLIAAQSGPEADAPPALQWARRPLWYAGQQLVLWGLGLPLGLLCVAGVIACAIGVWRSRHAGWLLLLGWTVGYFCWQSLALNPTMRYQLPVYPSLVVLGGWVLITAWSRRPGRRVLAAVLGIVVLTSTGAWAFAFTRIYSREVTRVAASRWMLQHIPGPINLHLTQANTRLLQPLPFPEGRLIAPEHPYVVSFEARQSGVIDEVSLLHVLDPLGTATTRTLFLTLHRNGDLGHTLASTEMEVAPTDQSIDGGPSGWFDHPVSVTAGDRFSLRVSVADGDPMTTLAGAVIANESSWDDGLPLRLDGIDPFGGLYQGLNFEMYWDDDERKRERFTHILDQADVLVITSSRQWGSTTRLPERYPLTTAYYRMLVGCPDELSVEHCFNQIEDTSGHSALGFDLVHVAVSDPHIGSWRINDQGAEEAFTVYDHPKVLVFVKSPAFDSARVTKLLGKVDLSHVVHLLPGKARAGPGDLLLPPRRRQELRAGGTFAELFPRARLVNRSPVVAALVWYLTLTLLGAAIFPLVRLALPGLPDQGFALARLVGVLLLGWLVWFTASLGVPCTRLTVALIAASLCLVGGGVAWHQRQALRNLWYRQRTSLLTIEAVIAVLFLLGLALRLCNPDLWHPSRGGEKPMELAYLTAVLKSTSFPPFDPWFAGGALNYYYLGWLLWGVPAKLLGILPSISFNLMLATVFALTAAAAMSLGYAISVAIRGRNHQNLAASRSRAAVVAAIACLVFTVVLGNLGTVQMTVNGLIRLGQDNPTVAASTLGRAHALVTGVGKAIAGADLPYGPGQWYWNPTRLIPDPQVQPITEFPCFSFLFGDLHPHLMDLPLLLLVCAWCVSFMQLPMRRGKQLLLGLAPSLLLGGLVVGSLRAVNTWSYYPFLLLALLSTLAWALLVQPSPHAPPRRVLVAAGVGGALVVLARVLYAPFDYWYGPGYTTVAPWTGARTPLGVYLLIWGVLLFFSCSWLARELQRGSSRCPVWLRQTALVLALGGGGALALLLHQGVTISLVVIPVGLGALVLVLRPGQPLVSTFVWFLLGTGLLITLTTELVVLEGDIGRMNTVFKLYLQAWVMLAVVAGVACGELTVWLLSRPRRLSAWTWVACGAVLVGAASLYPMIAIPARCQDRFVPDAPRSLDGSLFLQYAVYTEQGATLDLAEDGRAMRWMQDNVFGSPVIVEAYKAEYRWGARFSVYTGLPTVLGWNWHQRQQRALTPDEWIWRRLAAVEDFYTTTDLAQARRFLDRYEVSYIVVGQLEAAYYPGPGLAKFPAAEGMLWDRVYSDGATTIYRVRR